MKLVSPFVATIILVIITLSIGIGVYMYLSSVTKTTTTTEEVINCLGGDFKIINFNREKRIIDGLVGAWKFDEGSGTIAYDSSGNNNHGTLYNGSNVCSNPPTSGCPTWVDGKFGKALQFDGIDDYVEAPDSPNLDLPTSYTISAWVYGTFQKPDDNPWNTVVVKGWPDNYGLWIHKNLFLHHCATISNERQCINSAEGIVPQNQWIHVAATFDGIYMRTYLNGTKVVEGYYPGTLSTSDAPLRIGRHIPGWAYMNGIIDEVLIFNRALTDEEIKDLYSYYQNSEISNGRITILTNRYSFNLYFIGNPQSSLGSKYIAYITLKNDTVIKKDIDISPCNLGSECISSPTINIETDNEIKKVEICSKACSYVCSKYIVS